jgi:DNA-binding response OmpR family regulator
VIRIAHISATFITTGDIARGIASGASDYIVVPYEPQALIAVVRREAAWAH